MQDTEENTPPVAADPVRAAAAHRPDAPALIVDDTVLTWRELDARVDDIAGRLRAAVPTSPARSTAGTGHVAPRVALLLPNGLDFAVTYFATLRAGLVAVPLNPAYTPDERHHAITDSGATLVIGPDEVLPPVTGTPVPPPTVPADDLAVLLYTSGTGGRPKAAMLSHAALAANHVQLARIDPPLVGPDDVVLLTVPLFHAYGLNTGLGAVAHHGACGVLVEKFSDATLQAAARHGVTVTIGVPSMYAAWSRDPRAGSALARVRVAVCGAAPLDEADAARFAEVTGTTVTVGYGLTETAPVLTTTAVGTPGKAGSIGRPIPGVQLLLRSPDGQQLWRDGVAAGPDDPDELDLAPQDSPGTDPGEIVVRGANLFSGYWPDGRGGPDADGWWGTGDIAYADADGDLLLVDRIGELILVNGFNVYPAEIERVLDGHPGVAEAAVVGVPSASTGATPYAYVVPAVDPAPTPDELLRHCAGQLARYKLPTSVEVVAELPHSAIGKVRKTMLRSEGERS